MAKPSRRTQELPAKAALQVAAYIRVSTEDQAESGLGMEAQRTRCKAMCEVKAWPEPTFYVDDGISGTKDVDKRPGLQKLVDDIKAGKVNAVVIPSLDRLGRRMHIIINLLDAFNKHGVSLVSCKESFDTSTPQGQFVLHMFAALAQLERDLISQRTIDALFERSKRDGETGGRLPYGYVRSSDGVLVDTDAAKDVRRIFALHRRGASLREIGAKVGKPHTSVVEILRNRDAYKGGKRGESDVRWPVIVR